MSAEEVLWEVINDKTQAAIESWFDPTLSRGKKNRAASTILGTFGLASSAVSSSGLYKARQAACYTKYLEQIKKEALPLLSYYRGKPDIQAWLNSQINHVMNIACITYIIMPEYKTEAEQPELVLDKNKIADIAHVMALGRGYSEKRLEDLNSAYYIQIQNELRMWTSSRTTSELVSVESLFSGTDRSLTEETRPLHKRNS